MNGISRKDNIQNILLDKHVKAGTYKPYIDRDYFDQSSANHKIDEPRFYGAIYETSNKKIHVSSYGELLLKYESDELKRNKVFISMIFSIQFDNPYKKMIGFSIYPFRLIFRLLLDNLINKKISNIEIANILYYVKNLKNYNDYNLIIDKIKFFRDKSYNEKLKILQENSKQFIKNYVSTNYMINILSELNIIEKKFENIKFKIKSPNRKTCTNINLDYIFLKEEYIEFICKYLDEFTEYSDVKKPLGLRSDWIREIYNFVPEILLEEINEEDNLYTEFIQIPKLLLDSSKESSKWSVFEEYIAKAFNLFEDVKVENIGGPGEPDCLCYYVKENLNFCADAKSTIKKLSSINDGRLKQHRKKYNARYTIVVTPCYVPSAVEDIKGTNTCIITSYCFSDLISKYIFKLYKNKEECSYEIFNELVLANLGSDLSEKIYKIIDDKLGISK